MSWFHGGNPSLKSRQGGCGRKTPNVIQEAMGVIICGTREAALEIKHKVTATEVIESHG